MLWKLLPLDGERDQEYVDDRERPFTRDLLEKTSAEEKHGCIAHKEK